MGSGNLSLYATSAKKEDAPSLTYARTQKRPGELAHLVLWELEDGVQWWPRPRRSVDCSPGCAAIATTSGMVPPFAVTVNHVPRDMISESCP